MLDPAPYWRYYWVATMPDGTQIPQFDSSGKKFLWHNLPDKPVSITLVPFSEDLSRKVMAASRVAALPTNNPPTTLQDLGQGLLCGVDERFFTQQTVKCLSCGHQFPYNPASKAECPKCHTTDEWFCTQCQEMKRPLVVDKKLLCPDCKARGKTQGLKRIMKFQISAGGMSYDFQHWIRSPPVEVRVAHGEIIIKKLPEPNPQQ